MENDVVKLISIVLIIILLLLVMFLKYKENKKGKYATKCSSCESLNKYIHKKLIFIKTVKRHIPETKDLRTLSGNPILDAMDTKYFTIEEKKFDVEYKYLDCQHAFHQEFIR